MYTERKTRFVAFAVLGLALSCIALVSSGPKPKPGLTVGIFTQVPVGPDALSGSDPLDKYNEKFIEFYNQSLDKQFPDKEHDLESAFDILPEVKGIDEFRNEFIRERKFAHWFFMQRDSGLDMLEEDMVFFYMQYLCYHYKLMTLGNISIYEDEAAEKGEMTDERAELINDFYLISMFLRAVGNETRYDLITKIVCGKLYNRACETNPSEKEDELKEEIGNQNTVILKYLKINDIVNESSFATTVDQINMFIQKYLPRARLPAPRPHSVLSDDEAVFLLGDVRSSKALIPAPKPEGSRIVKILKGLLRRDIAVIEVPLEAIRPSSSPASDLEEKVKSQ